MAKRPGRKIKASSPEAIAARRDEQRRAAVNDVGAAIGMPEAQRGHHAVAIVPSAVDGAPRPQERTLRKLTRAERLLNSGAINKRQMAAITLYIDAAELAYGDCQRVANYGEGGGSSPTIAAAAAHMRQLDRAYDADRYIRARAAIGRHVAPFERIVLDNHPLGQVGADLYPGSSAGTVSAAVRVLVAQCADLIGIAFEHELGPSEDLQPVKRLMQTMRRFDEQVRADRAVEAATSATPVQDALARALAGTAPRDVLMLAKGVAEDLKREARLDAYPTEWLRHPVVVVARWRYGWLVQPPASDA